MMTVHSTKHLSLALDYCFEIQPLLLTSTLQCTESERPQGTVSGD